MLTYLYVAIGGAIGSVARAWMANAVTRALGPDFPWGTIFINILGSFVIGFFGALTASDGRFPSHPDARAFVMVGICGGFTTFSSFSLQTLDLAKDGKLGAAFANIAISVILCVAAVTAGFASAQAINSSARPPKEADGKAMGGVVLAVLDRPATVSAVLSAAARLLTIGGGGTIHALAVRTPPVSELMAPDQVLTHAEEAQFRAAQSAWAAEVRAKTLQWEAEGPRPNIGTRFIEVEGDIVHLAAEYGRRYDSAVVAANARQPGKPRDALHAAIFDTSRAVLVTPPESAGAFGRVVAVAWKDDSRAPKAVRSALPILQKAEAVHVLRAGAEAAAVPDILIEHGVRAFAHAVADNNGPAGAALLAAAHELGADLIVMGAYAHGEWREALLGGVTRHMLGHADLPLFLQH
jgi:protein CrcB